MAAFNVIMNGASVDLSNLLKQIEQELFDLSQRDQMRLNLNLLKMEVESRIIRQITLPDEVDIEGCRIYCILNILVPHWRDNNFDFYQIGRSIRALQKALNIKDSVFEQALSDCVQYKTGHRKSPHDAVMWIKRRAVHKW